MSDQTTPVRPGEPEMLLEDVVTALQKTFSRVNSITQKNREDHPEKPTSRLGRLVEFDATVRVAPHGTDFLKVAADGPIDLRFKGQIENDIEYVLNEEPKLQSPPDSDA